MCDSEDEEEEQWAVPLENSTCSKTLPNCTPQKSTASLKTTESVDDDSNHDQVSLFMAEPLYGHRRTIVQIDIDCFYAQVEMIRNPRLRNKPLGIQQKYIVVTCNYKAREYGVTKLMTIKDAKDKCPHLILVSGEDLSHYRAMSYRITELLQKYSPVVERLGFDENFLDISDVVKTRLGSGHNSATVEGYVYTPDGSEESGSQPRKQTACGCGCHLRLAIGSQVAAEIRQALAEELSITCCAGIAHNKLLAKLVGSVHKPNKQTTLFPEDVPTFMVSLSNIRAIPGIGHSAVKKLAGMGVVSVTDLQNCDMDSLLSEFDETQSWKMKQLSRGIDESQVKLTGQPQSISDEDSFKKCSTLREAKEKIQELVTSLLVRVHEDGRIPQTIRLTVRKFTTTNKYGNRESRQCAIPSYVFSNFSPDSFPKVKSKLCDLLIPLFHKMVDVQYPFHLTLINVCFAKLSENAKNKISSFFGQAQSNSNMSPSTSVKSETNSNPQRSASLKQETNIEENKDVVEDWVTAAEPRDVSNCGGKMEKSTPALKNRKRLFSSDSNVSEKKIKLNDKEPRLGSSGRIIAESGYPHAARAQSQHVNDKIPAGIDADFYRALPADIQKEFLQDKLGHTDRRSTPKGQKTAVSEVTSSTSSKGQQKLESFCHRKYMTHASGPVVDQSHQMLPSLGSQDCGSKGTVPIFPRLGPTGCNAPSCTSEITVFGPELDDVTNVDRASSEPPLCVIPQNVDKEIFMSLPGDVQKELLADWRRATVSQDSERTSLTSQVNNTQKGMKHSQKKKSSPSILKYYQKRT